MAIKSPNAATCSPIFTLWMIVEIVIIVTTKLQEDTNSCVCCLKNLQSTKGRRLSAAKASQIIADWVDAEKNRRRRFGDIR